MDQPTDERIRVKIAEVLGWTNLFTLASGLFGLAPGNNAGAVNKGAMRQRKFMPSAARKADVRSASR